MNSAFRSHLHAGRTPLDKHHVFCRCKQVQKTCNNRTNGPGTAPDLAEQCKLALSGALLSLAAATFVPSIAPAMASGAPSLSPDVPVVSVHCLVRLGDFCMPPCLCYGSVSHEEGVGIRDMLIGIHTSGEKHQAFHAARFGQTCAEWKRAGFGRQAEGSAGVSRGLSRVPLLPIFLAVTKRTISVHA